jgi:predicted HTH transcriptional regulator
MNPQYQDIKDLLNLKESNNLEAKKAQGGLPDSLWETYSAFANTDGGFILLGVDEDKITKKLIATGLSNPENLVKQFIDLSHNRKKVNVCVTSNKGVRIEEIDGKKIIAIYVPRADVSERPIYINQNMLNTYRRDGEGDYKCSQDELETMIREKTRTSPDIQRINNMGLDVFDMQTVKKYQNRFRNTRPGHVWADIDSVDLLIRLGAAEYDDDGELHPTVAGLLVFGNEYEIVRRLPNYFLDYQEHFESETRWTDRFVSSSGDWSGNLYDFYFRSYNKIAQIIKTPFAMDENSIRIDDTPVHKAVREALVNTLTNADYFGEGGVVVHVYPTKVTLRNPGHFRIDLQAAKSGGFSMPRNATILKMFHLLDIEQRAGSGIPNIYAVWNEQGFPEPAYAEDVKPDRTTLTLFFEKNNAPLYHDVYGTNDTFGTFVSEEMTSIELFNLSDIERAVYEFIKLQKPQTLEILAQGTQKSLRTIKRITDTLQKQNLIRKINRDGKKCWDVI